MIDKATIIIMSFLLVDLVHAINKRDLDDLQYDHF